MKTALLAIASISILSASDHPMTLDFDKNTKWFSVNDGVMGGLSQGKPTSSEGNLIFQGTLSLENNGGFSSIRHDLKSIDLSDADGLTLRVRGDGRSYQLRLATGARYNGSRISYGTSFATEKDQWTTVTISFSDLKPSWRGRKLDGPELGLKDLQELGLLIGDKKPGTFKLEVDWIKSASQAP